MPIRKFSVKRGDPIKAADFNSMLEEMRRLATWAVAPPLELKTGPAGFQLGIAAIADAVAIVKFEAHSGGSYPSASSNCKRFPAIIYADAKFEETGACTQFVEVGEKGPEILVYNIREVFVPKDLFLFAFRFHGQWWVDFIRWKVKGKLSAEMTSGGNVDMKVWAIPSGGGAEADTGETIKVHDWLLDGGQKIESDVPVVAFYDVQSKRYYVDGAKCG